MNATIDLAQRRLIDARARMGGAKAEFTEAAAAAVHGDRDAAAKATAALAEVQEAHAALVALSIADQVGTA